MTLLDAIADRILLADGAMGTELQRAGLALGACGEAWNLERPEVVGAIQRRYADAGVDCLLTNTFGANRLRLEQHLPDPDVAAINAAAVRIARAALGDGGFVLGDIGPVGVSAASAGRRVQAALTEQAAALCSAGVDAIIVETQIALDELAIAVAAAQRAGAPCVIASVAFNRVDGELRSVGGATPEDAVIAIVDSGADVIGTNCGAGVDAAVAAEIVRRYRARCSLPVMVQPNAGQPVLRGGAVRYPQTPDDLAKQVPEVLAAGGSVIGGCCGTTPEHIARLRAVIDARRSDG